MSFYVAGEDDAVGNFLFLFDDFMVWKMKQLDKNVQVQIHQHATQHVDQEFVRSLNYEHYSLLSVDDDSELPLKWYESQPVIGKKLVTMVIQVEDEKSCSVLWGGNTWAFRQALDENGVSGAYFEDDSETMTKDGDSKSARRYFRVLKNIDVSAKDGSSDKVKDTIEKVFHNLNMKCSIEGSALMDDSPLAYWIESELKSMSCLHW